MDKLKQNTPASSFQPIKKPSWSESSPRFVPASERFEVPGVKTRKLQEQAKVSEANEDCTFRPTITRKGERTKGMTIGADRFTHLYKEAEQLRLKKAERRMAEM
jgi:hypothetical protein